jgi:hypothetical protein
MRKIAGNHPPVNPIRPVLNVAARRHEVSINGIVVGYVPVPQNSQATARLIGKLRYVAATRKAVQA